jgi:hypothetical protein
MLGAIGAALSPHIGSIIGSALGFAGQERTNAQNLRIAREQMGFQERMRNTQWQAGIADMEAAGLNPALAYSKGGAAAPQGAGATMQNSMASALQAARVSSELKTLKANAKEAKANADIAAETARVRAGRGQVRIGEGRWVPGMSMIERLALIEEDERNVLLTRADLENLGVELRNIQTGVMTAGSRQSQRMREPIAGIADKFGMWGPLAGAALSAAGPAMQAGRGASALWKARRLAALRNVSRGSSLRRWTPRYGR